ncbi:flavin reductase family protein [Roseovarius pelagicus]|uniref:Flavin reductase family protein n=1 Tax=Roseovarius pelagicus TaxID=2980108 RepID=A0ABY6DA18_9RHOB|nr:flavin reductase family protein [Roseovarius pelagicus]UXX82957.1 flavin reductase family protein [Roseovarius pelagicus]
MFYEPKNGHGLPHSPFNAIVSPRPIGWISTIGADGVRNVAPYSFFNAVAYVPPQVMFASSGNKDSVHNIRETGVFCTNVVAQDMRHPMNASSATVPRDVDEFVHAGLEVADCTTINCPRIAGVPASMECRMTHILELGGQDNYAIFGEVTGVHIRDDCLVNGLFDVTTFQPLSRLGYRDYAVVENVFTLERPDD